MADFCQNDVITTLQKIKDRPIEDIEKELRRFTRRRKLALLLPALVSEFDGEAMPRIIEELKSASYVSKFVLSLDKADSQQFAKVKQTMAELPGEVRVVWHDGPRMQELYQELRANDFKLDFPGKGRSVWMTLGYILAADNIHTIALHDCDIVNYRRELLARLVYPIINPAIDIEFSKGYYARVTDRLYGRVTRLFYTPLIKTMKKIVGYQPFIEYLDDFRYALSGEFAFVDNLARRIRISPTWGLEVSMLSEVYQMTSVNRICQVELMDTYEHKHQSLKKDSPNEGLVRMATDIAKAMFRVLSQDGIILSDALFRSLQTTYIQESRLAIEKYNALAMINGLGYDRHSEIEAVDAFVNSLKLAIDEFARDPVGIPMLPAWVRIAAALPDFQERLSAAVEADNQ